MKGAKSTLPALAVALLFGCAYFPIFQILVGKWANSDDYSHAFLVVPIICYMVWLKREVLVAKQATGHGGLLLVLLANALYLISLRLQIPTLIAIAMVMTVVSALSYVAGVRVLRQLAVPICLLLMVIPIPNQIYAMLTMPLQIKVSAVSALIIQGVGIPLFREGNVLSLPDKTFQVVEACSGLRSLISLTTLTLILGYFSLRNTLCKVVLLAASLPVAFLVNILRVTTLILVYHSLRLDLAEGTMHTVMGLVLFGMALVILFALLRLLEQWEAAGGVGGSDSEIPPQGALDPGSTATRGSGAAGQGEKQERLIAANRTTKLIILIAVLLATCVGVYAPSATKPVAEHPSLKRFLGTIAGYTTDEVPLKDDIYRFLDLDDYAFTGYTAADGSKVNLFVGYYYSADKVSAAHSPLTCYPGQGWAIAQPVLRQLVVGERTIHYAELEASRDGGKELVLFWYQAGNSTSSFVFKNKIRVLSSKLTTGNEEHAFVRISVPFVGSGQDRARARGTEFMKAFYPKFIEFMDHNGDQAVRSPVVD